jgi:hypothetical protein
VLLHAGCTKQVPAYLRRNKQTIALEKQQLEEYIKLREQPVSGGKLVKFGIVTDGN